MGMMLIALTIIGAVITGATLMLFYAQSTNDVDADVILTHWSVADGEANAEDLALTENIADGVGGNSYEYIHWFNYSANTQNDLDVLFTITDSGVDDAEGIYFTVYVNDSGSWTELTDEVEGSDTYTFTAGGENVQFKTEYVFDTYLEEGDYQYTLDVTRST